MRRAGREKQEREVGNVLDLSLTDRALEGKENHSLDGGEGEDEYRRKRQRKVFGVK